MLSKEYLNNPRMSQSQLKIILDGIEEFKHNLDHPKPPSDSQNLGSAVHILVLEPERSDMIVKKPLIDYTTREGKIFKFLVQGKGPDYFPVTTKKKKNQEKGLFYEVDQEEMDFIYRIGNEYGRVLNDPDKYILLSDSDYEDAHKMAAAVFKNEDTSLIIRSSQYLEKTHHFEYMGIEFKCQLDGHGLSPFILDLKSTIIKNKDAIIRNEIRARRYHFQASCYRKVFNDPDMPYYILWVRNVAPFAVFPIELSDDLLSEGDYEFDEACTIYNHCLKYNPEFIPNNRLRIV